MSLEDADIATQDESGRPIVCSLGFPGPAPRNEPYMDLDEEKDERDVKRIEDVWEHDNPTTDTPDQFPLGIHLSRQSDGIEWEPHRLIGPGPGVRALISTSKTFVPPGELPSDLPSSTSRCHHPKVPRPARAGAGWGDHDKFQEWQLHGRALDEKMVNRREWLHEDPPTIQTVRPRAEAANEAQGIEIANTLKFDDPLQPMPFPTRYREVSWNTSRRVGKESHRGAANVAVVEASMDAERLMLRKIGRHGETQLNHLDIDTHLGGRGIILSTFVTLILYEISCIRVPRLEETES
ncbi:hypothetical protein ACHAPT_011187 [Fusarium lateritium]